MPRNQRLDSKVESDGIFWEPGAPDVKFAGKVLRVGRRIEFTTSPVFEQIDSARVNDFFTQFNQPNEPEDLPVLLGVLGGTECTLLWLHPLLEGGFGDLSRMEAVSYRRYRVSACVMGVHIPEHNSEIIKSARISYTALMQWQRARYAFDITDSTISLVLNRKDPPIIHVSSIQEKVGYSFDVRSEVRNQTSEIRIRNEAVLEIMPEQPMNIDWILGKSNRALTFFALLIGSSLQIESVGVIVDAKIGWCRRRIRGKTDEVKYNITVKPNTSDFAVGLVRWMDLPASFDPLENLLYTIRDEKASVAAEFLSLAQALEGFQRLTSAPSSGKRVYFSVRMNELLSRISPAFCDRLLEDAEFVEKLRTTRDHLTHPGLELKPTVILDNRELFLFKVKCGALLRLLLLLYVGIPEECLRAPIFEESRAWT